jgi:hypothetical protein
MDSFLKAAPSGNDNTGLSTFAGSLPGDLGGVASTAASFDKLGLSPDMMGKFAPILLKFVQAKGGSNIASLLSGVLK